MQIHSPIVSLLLLTTLLLCSFDYFIVCYFITSLSPFTSSISFPMTIEDLLRSPTYSKKPILEKLICHACWLTNTQIFTQMHLTLSKEQEDRITNGYRAYTGEKQPLEYILWYVEFLWLRFSVSSATLIPRPETEYMIEAVKEFTRSQPDTRFDLLDIWTWCGVLWLSVIYYAPDNIESAILADLSGDALRVAQKNWILYKDDLTATPQFLEANLLDHEEITNIIEHTDHLLLVANLPYIPDQMFDDNVDDWVKKREPKIAFVWGDDGLDLYRIMFEQLLNQKKVPQTTMFLEMMTRQVEILKKEYENHFQFEEVKTFHFNIRIVKVSM